MSITHDTHVRQLVKPPAVAIININMTTTIAKRTSKVTQFKTEVKD